MSTGGIFRWRAGAMIVVAIEYVGKPFGDNG